MTYQTVEIRSKVDDQTWVKCMHLRFQHITSLAYLIKENFTSLRPVRRWLWRRGQVSRDYWWDKSGVFNNCDLDALNGYDVDDVWDQNTAILPDYPSIRELEIKETK